MKKIFTFLFIVSLCMGMAENASATAVYSASNTHDGIYSGNDNINNIITSIDDLVVGVGIFRVGKISDPTETNGEDRDYGGFSLTFDTAHKSGTWINSLGFDVDYITIKAGNGFIVYDVKSNFYYTKGTPDSWNWWSTEGLKNGGGNQPEVSHISFWSKVVTPVPVPAAVWLLGTGLVGLVGVRRKQRK